MPSGSGTGGKANVGERESNREVESREFVGMGEESERCEKCCEENGIQ